MNRSARKLQLVATVAALMIVASVGCYNSTSGDTTIGGMISFKLPVLMETGSNRVQVFTEMHYQPKFEVQEVPRLLPPDSSIPVSGREMAYASLAEYSELAVPDDVNETYDRAQAADLYRVNCQVCHGENRTGQGPARQFMTRGALPADLTAAVTQNSTDGELYAFISWGGRQGYALLQAGRESNSPMPAYHYLLQPEDRWALVKYLRGH